MFSEVDFTWAHPDGGWQYAWETRRAFVLPGDDRPEAKALAGEHRFLVYPQGAEKRVIGYDPLESHPELFATFAHLEESPKAFAAFATKYGPLGVSVALLLERDNQQMLWGRGEPFFAWEHAHQKIQRIADVVLAVRDRNADAVRPLLSVWDTGARFEWHYANAAPEYRGWRLICETKHGHRTEVWKWASGAPTEAEKLLRLATAFAQEEINEAMSGESNTTSAARLLFDVARKDISLFLAPNTLLAAMWLQCATTLTGESHPRVGLCQHCGKRFAVTGRTGRRRDSKYCSSRCKVAAHRAHKAAAGRA